MRIVNMTENNTDSVLDLIPEKSEVHQEYAYEKILFGLFFICLALSWLIIKPVRRRKDSKCELPGDFSPLSRFLQSLPSAGISKLILTGLTIILTVLVTSAEDSLPGSETHIGRLSLVTIYLAFALTGIVDILCFYSYPRSLLPRHTDSLSLGLAFLTELLLLPSLGLSSPLLQVTVLCSLGVSLSRLVSLSPASLSSLCLSSLSLTQGSWSLHTSLSPASVSQPLPSLLFSWHLLASFILCTCLSAGLRYLTRPRSVSKPASHVPASGDLSNPTGLTVTINREAMARSDIEALGHQEATDTDNTSLTSVPSSQGVSVDSEEGQEEAGVRVSPLEEFNTLHRHREGVRKSIKLKESSIV